MISDKLERMKRELAASLARETELRESMREVLRISDRKHDAWDRAYAALAMPFEDHALRLFVEIEIGRRMAEAKAWLTNEATHKAALKAERAKCLKICEDTEVERTTYCMHVYEEGEQYKSAIIAAISAMDD